MKLRSFVKILAVRLTSARSEMPKAPQTFWVYGAFCLV